MVDFINPWENQNNWKNNQWDASSASVVSVISKNDNGKILEKFEDSGIKYELIFESATTSKVKIKASLPISNKKKDKGKYHYYESDFDSTGGIQAYFPSTLILKPDDQYLPGFKKLSDLKSNFKCMTSDDTNVDSSFLHTPLINNAGEEVINLNVIKEFLSRTANLKVKLYIIGNHEDVKIEEAIDENYNKFKGTKEDFMLRRGEIVRKTLFGTTFKNIIAVGANSINYEEYPETNANNFGQGVALVFDTRTNEPLIK